MSNKVTRFETSKKLDELGFDCESHTGLYSPEGIYCTWDGGYRKGFIEAYSCWDLLMWFNKQQFEQQMQLDTTDDDIEVYLHKSGLKNDLYFDAQPQEALGKAVVAILEEQR